MNLPHGNETGLACMSLCDHLKLMCLRLAFVAWKQFIDSMQWSTFDQWATSNSKTYKASIRHLCRPTCLFYGDRKALTAGLGHTRQGLCDLRLAFGACIMLINCTVVKCP